MITKQQLLSILPHINSNLWLDHLNHAMTRFEINTPIRQAAFIAQCAHESREFTVLVENLSYSAERLVVVFPKYFKDIGFAKAYARNPEKLANFIYAGRMGNGNESSGDGYSYRGRGLIMITGRWNYRNIGNLLDMPLDAKPQLLEKFESAVLSAACFWKNAGLNAMADDNSPEAFEKICQRINGGKLGLNERIVYWNKLRSALGIM